MKKVKIIKITVIILIISYWIYNISGTINTINDKKLVKNYFNSNDKEIAKQTKDNYIGILEIPKIKLQKGFYDINNKKNNVNKNIQVLKNSTMPSENNSVLAIASHSGNGKKAFFKNLYKLEINDQINIYYQNKIYYTVNASNIILVR